MINLSLNSKKSQLRNLLIALIPILLLQACLLRAPKTINYQAANTHYDQVKERYVQELKYDFYGQYIPDNSFISAKQRTVKYTNKSGGMRIEVFDILKMRYNNFQLEPSVYIVLNDSSFQLPLATLVIERQASIEEDTEDILTADSSSVTVVTDYTLNQHKLITSSYVINMHQAQAIVNSSELCYRYYYGPEIVDLKLSPSRLKKLKTVISSNPSR